MPANVALRLRMFAVSPDRKADPRVVNSGDQYNSGVVQSGMQGAPTRVRLDSRRKRT